MSTTIGISIQEPTATHEQRVPLARSAADHRRVHSTLACSGALSDEALITLVAQKDKSAMHALYSRYSVRMYRFAIRLTGNSSLGEDIVSDTFVDVWRNAHTFRAQSTVSTWLYSIARHKALTTLRRRTDQALDDEQANEIEDNTNTPEESVIESDRGMLLQSCLTKLSTLHREVIDLVNYHGKSIQEVAQIVGVSENTIKTRLHYARNRIELLLAQAGVTTFH